MIFWVIIFLICALIWIFFYRTITQKAPDIVLNSDLEVYKDQLVNIETELSRGIIAIDEAERIKAEVSRRIIEIGKRKKFALKKETKQSGLILSTVFLIILIAGGSFIYQEFGAPGYENISQSQRIKNANELLKGRATQGKLLQDRGNQQNIKTP